MGLTTNQAPFIEQARAEGELYIQQPYELYSEANHRAWQKLFQRMQGPWQKYGNPWFLEGLAALSLPPDRVPRLSEVNAFLMPRTGFQARAVSGYVPAFTFFDCLRERAFPTTITIRCETDLDYLPEPDIFHDIAGHVPMHTHPAFAEALVRFGDCAHTAAELARAGRDEAKLASIVRALARFFWFTIEFGLMKTPEGLRAYGSGLLSSYGELQHSIESREVNRHPLQLEWVIHQGFDIDHYQPLLFWIDGFDHLFDLVDTLNAWMQEGRLDNVAPGEPQVSAEDLAGFMRG